MGPLTPVVDAARASATPYRRLQRACSSPETLATSVAGNSIEESER
jgi:hypothetical protein